MSTKEPKLTIEYLPVDSIKRYGRNAKKHTKTQVSQIRKSISEFSFNDPVAVWGPNNELVEGEGRLLAAIERGMKEIPVIRLDHLTDKQRREYGWVHNALTLNTGLDMDTIRLDARDVGSDLAELSELGLEIPDITDGDIPEDVDEDEYDFSGKREIELREIPRLQHNTFDNFERAFEPELCGKYDIPVMAKTTTTGDTFARFCDWKDEENPEDVIAHFYYDDYKFINSWRDPDVYIERLRRYKAVIAPDYSLYTDFPLALQIMSCYRRQWIGAYWQSLGLDVIPDVVWGEERSFEFCFDGIPKGGTVAVSSVGVSRDPDWNGTTGNLFKDGYDEMMRRIEPEMVLFYGDIPDGLSGHIIQIPVYYQKVGLR